MNFSELIIGRRSIRRFTDKDISAEDARVIIQAALLSPSSKMSRPWHFILVEEKEVLEKLSETRAMGAAPIAACKLAVVVAADSSLTGAWIEDASIAATYIQLQAQALGLGTCWIQVRDRFDKNGDATDDKMRDILGVPENISIECVIVIGYPAEDKKPQNIDKLLWERVHIGKW